MSENLRTAATYDVLKGLIVNFQFRPGEHLQINDLADQLQVSVTPIREALLRLSSESLVVSVPNRGFFCKNLDIGELQDLYNLAYLILSYSIKNATEASRTLDFTNPLHATAHTAPGQELDLGSREALACSHALLVERLNTKIAQLSNNREFEKIVRNFNERTHYVRVIYYSIYGVRHINTSTVFDLVENMERKDAKAATRLLHRAFQAKIHNMGEVVKEALVRTYVDRTSAGLQENVPARNIATGGWA